MTLPLAGLTLAGLTLSWLAGHGLPRLTGLTWHRLTLSGFPLPHRFPTRWFTLTHRLAGSWFALAHRFPLSGRLTFAGLGRERLADFGRGREQTFGC